MPASFLARHRTICAALMELRSKLVHPRDMEALEIVDECLTYARAMSNKLTEYKMGSHALMYKEEEKDGKL